MCSLTRLQTDFPWASTKKSRQTGFLLSRVLSQMSLRPSPPNPHWKKYNPNVKECGRRGGWNYTSGLLMLRVWPFPSHWNNMVFMLLPWPCRETVRPGRAAAAAAKATAVTAGASVLSHESSTSTQCVYTTMGARGWGRAPLSDYSCEDVRMSRWRRRWRWRSQQRQEVDQHVGGGTRLLLTSVTCYNTLRLFRTGSRWLWLKSITGSLSRHFYIANKVQDSLALCVQCMMGYIAGWVTIGCCALFRVMHCGIHWHSEYCCSLRIQTPLQRDTALYFQSVKGDVELSDNLILIMV